LSRRVKLPGADDLFRPTVVPDQLAADAAADASADAAAKSEAEPEVSRRSKARSSTTGDDVPGDEGLRKPSGRVRHDEKMTVYVTSDELLDIEQARLLLRRDQGLAVDRGRLVREALALALADYDERGPDSLIVARLTQT